MGHHHRGRMGRGGRIGRFLEHGDLRFVVLGLLAEQPRHGYDLIRELEERTGGEYRPSPGVIYPTLSLLEDEGFVTPVAAEGGRKLYEITPAGKEALEAERPAVDRVFSRMDEARAKGVGTGPRVARAMQNLGAALGVRLGQGPVTPELVDAICTVIDEAAAKVERA
jgi:DNA-binding PadR family transcriptional regulator